MGVVELEERQEEGRLTRVQAMISRSLNSNLVQLHSSPTRPLELEKPIFQRPKAVGEEGLRTIGSDIDRLCRPAKVIHCIVDLISKASVYPRDEEATYLPPT